MQNTVTFYTRLYCILMWTRGRGQIFPFRSSARRAAGVHANGVKSYLWTEFENCVRAAETLQIHEFNAKKKKCLNVT